MYFIMFFIYVLGHTYTINLKSFSELKDTEVSNWFWQKWRSFPFFVACKCYIMIITKLLSSLRLHPPCLPTLTDHCDSVFSVCSSHSLYCAVSYI